MAETPTITQTNLETLVQKYDYFIFDCDGVLFHAGDEIGDAFKSLKYIQQFPDKRVFFFTNAATRTREELLKEKIIGEHGFTTMPLENLYTAGYLASLYVKDQLIPARLRQDPGAWVDREPSVFVIGEQSFKKELESHGIRVANPLAHDYLNPSNTYSFDEFETLEVDPTVLSVIVATDYELSFKKVCEASLYLTQNKAELIGCNIDRTDGKDRLRPSGGSITKLIETAAGSGGVTVMGKPDRFGFDLLRKQHGLEDEPLSKFVMVGDNLETDILLGNRCGIDSLLVLSGVTNAQRAEDLMAQVRSGEFKSKIEGVPTHVQSLFAQSSTINFDEL